MKYKNPTYARLLGIWAAILTPVQMVTISMIPSTHPRSVVCRGVNPNEETIIERWFVRELGTLLRAEKSANNHVFGSRNASIILKWHWKGHCKQRWTTHWSLLKCLFSTPVWFSWRQLCSYKRIRRLLSLVNLLLFFSPQSHVQQKSRTKQLLESPGRGTWSRSAAPWF